MNGMSMPTDKMQSMALHFDEHITYPATKQDIIDACNKMADVEAEDKKWVEDNLPDKTYMSADEVKEALGFK